MGLGLGLMEHLLSIKDGFKPFWQLSRRMHPSSIPKVNEELEQLLKVSFIPRYTEWLPNIDLVTKKNKKLRVCIDFRINTTIPEDAYPMLITNMLVDPATYNELLSFIYGYSSYN